MRGWMLIIIVILSIFLVLAVKQVKDTEENWKVAMANVKAYNEMLSSTHKTNEALQLTVSQMEYYQDSILKALNETRKELKIKGKNTNSMQYIASTFTKTDTLLLRDTVFRSPSFRKDTVLGDEWYKVNVGLAYPSTIFVHQEFKSEKHIVVSTKKETVNPPKKFWLFRLFQKKHRVLKVDVIEKNPYVDNQESRYIEII